MLPRMLILAVVLSLTGCGRIATTGAAPTAPIAPAEAEAPAPAPEGLSGLEARVRPHLGRHREAPLAALTIGPVLASGELTNSMSAGSEFGFWVPGDAGHRYRTVRIDALGRAQLRSAFGETQSPPPPLALDQLPAPAAAIASAKRAGLPEGESYEVEYLATIKGPLVRVANRIGGKAKQRLTIDGRSGEPVSELEAQRAFGALGRR